MLRWFPTVLMLAAVAGPLAAQQPVPFDPYRSTIDTNLRQYTDPVIQAELKLTDEQKAKIAKIPDDLLAKHKDAIEKEKTADKEAADKRAALTEELQKKFDAMVEKHLTADQRKRLKQMTLQAMGVQAFYDEEVTKALALPKDFTTKLREIQQANQEKLRKDYPNVNAFPPSLSQEERQKVAEARRKATQDTFTQVVATLTDEQKKVWKELIGEPFEIVADTGPGAGRFGRFFFSMSQRSSLQSGLLTNDKALTELKVEKADREAIATDWKAIQDAALAGNGGFERGPGGPPALPQTVAEETLRAARQVLTEPQTRRLEQIRFQMNGTAAFSANGIADSIEYRTATGGGSIGSRAVPTSPLLKLKLTPAQVVKIDAVLADVAKKELELGRQGPPFFGDSTPPDATLTDEQKARLEASRKAREEYQRKWNEIETKAMADITATFDAGQKAAWKEFTGEPFDVTKATSNQVGGRGRFGGFGGPNGPGGRAQSIVAVWTREASLRLNLGEYAAALAAYDEAIRLAPTNTVFVQGKARLLATCPSEWVRDGKQAVELMKKVMAETKEPASIQHDTLAAAYAECGQFDEAVKAQEKAIAALPPPADDLGGGFNPAARLKPQYEERLKLYQDKKPYRTPTPTGPGGGGVPGGGR